MEECLKCHRSEREVRLFDVIYENEVVKMCERCAILEEIPIIKRPTTSQLKETEKNYSVYQRLKRMAGLEKKEDKHEESILDRIRKLDENPELEMPEEESTNLVHNFHWYIMRARRNKGLSQRQLAWALGESEAAIKMLERGELPGEPKILIKKLEQFLQVKLRERTEKEIKEEKEKFRESSFLRRRALEREKQESSLGVREKEEDVEFGEPVSEIIIESENEEDIVSSVAYGKVVDTEIGGGSVEKTPARVLSFKPDTLKNLTIDDLQKMKQEREKAEKLVEAGEEKLEAEDFVQEARKEEKRKQELREEIADEMRDEALGKKVEVRKQSNLGGRELLKKRDYVPSISELAARKREKEQMKMTGKDNNLNRGS